MPRMGRVPNENRGRNQTEVNPKNPAYLPGSPSYIGAKKK